MKKFSLNVFLLIFLLFAFSVTAGASQSFGEVLSNVVTIPENAVSQGSTKENFISKVSQLPSKNNVVMPFEVMGELKIYVSPTGLDSNDGSIEKPLKTLKKALEKVAALNYSEKKGGVVIYLREGQYHIDKTLTINGKHSGLDDAPLYIAAYPGETPTFSTSLSFDLAQAEYVTDEDILNRIPDEAKGKVKVIDMMMLGVTDFPDPYFMGEIGTPYEKMVKKKAALFLGEERLNAARYPNTGYIYIKEFLKSCPVLRGPEINGVNDGSGIEFVIEDDEVFDWYNTEKIVVEGSTRSNYDLVNLRIKELHKDKMSISTYGMPETGCELGHGAAVYFTNALEAIDTEGEWYADVDEGKIYVYPYEVMMDETLYISYESHDMIKMAECKNIVFDGLTFKNAASVAINGDFCENIVVQRCDFSNLNSSVNLYKAKNSGVTTCSFYANTSAPVALYAHSKKEGAGGDGTNDLVAMNLFIQNCYFCMGDTLNDLYTSTVAGAGCVISHNFYQNGYGSAITPSTSLGYVEYNEVVGCAKSQNDGGPFYSCSQWSTFGTIVRYNFFHNPSAIPNNCKGIYFDDGTGFFTVYGNVVHDATQAIFAHNGRSGVVFNNILLDSIQAFATSDNFLSSTNWRNGWDTIGLGWYTGINSNNIRPQELQWQRQMPGYYKVKQTLDKVYEQRDNGEMSPDNLVMSDEERWLRTATDFYVANNIYNAGEILITPASRPTIEMENNYKVSNDVFADYENFDLRVVDQELLEKIPGFVQIPFDKIGLIKGTPKWENMEIGEITPIFPKPGYENRVSSSDIYFDWLQVKYATQYQLIIAKDKEFKDIVFDQHFDHSTAVVSLEEPGIKYYYKIIAKSLAKQLDYAERESEIFEFDTMTYDEANLVSKAEKSGIKAALNKLKKINLTLVEGEEAGQYPVGTKTKLANYIKEIEEFIETVNVQREINLKIPEINAFIHSIQKTIVPGKVTKPSFETADWYPRSRATVELAPGSFTIAKTDDDNILVEGKDNELVWFKDKTDIPYNSFVSFKFKVSQFSPFLVLGFQYEKDGIMLWDADSYLLIVMDNVVELQKYLEGAPMNIVDSVENDGVFKLNEWSDVVLGTIATENGTRFIAIVDGKLIFDYLDEVNPIYMESRLSLSMYAKQINAEFGDYEISYEEIMNIVNSNQKQ